MLKPFEPQHTGDQNAERIQENIKKFAKPLADNPTLDGRIVEGIVFDGVNDTTFNHKLGRKPRGFHPVDIETGAGMAIRFGRSAWDTNTITLFANAACTASFWVF